MEAQWCSGQAVKGLPSAAPVQELQPGTPVTTSPERPLMIITFVHQTTRSGIGLIAAEPHGSTAGATKGGTAGGVFRRPRL